MDLLEGLLALNPARRLRAHDALAHPYFADSPSDCENVLKLDVEGDSHEFLLRVQQANKALSISAASDLCPASGPRSCTHLGVGAKLAQAVKPRREYLTALRGLQGTKRTLTTGAEDNTSLEPTAKEFIPDLR